MVDATFSNKFGSSLKLPHIKEAGNQLNKFNTNKQASDNYAASQVDNLQEKLKYLRVGKKIFGTDAKKC